MELKWCHKPYIVAINGRNEDNSDVFEFLAMMTEIQSRIKIQSEPSGLRCYSTEKQLCDERIYPNE